ncbi:hypothetical protein NQ318_013326 [Aromia moschata]|uniref:Proline-rich protein PRCC n=1 Tax=Aromia moschata TaxID=1265417 RepID=A0AAV8XYM0_9CUCU|nr:hypothetical protein NQ318_013326 [Aromia moschata]
MALVAYEYDSNSEDDTAEENIVIPVGENSPQTSSHPNNEASKEELTESKSIFSKNTENIFSNLPQTKTYPVKIVEDQIEDFVPKLTASSKEKHKVKITIPSLSQFADIDNDEEPETKRIKPSAQSSGLMSILPPVKGSVTTTKSFVPNVVATKTKNITSNNMSAKTTKMIPNVLKRKADSQKSIFLNKIQRKETKSTGSDIESDDDIDVPETFDDEMWEKVCGRPKPKQIVQQPEEELSEKSIDIAPEPEKPYDGLDNKAFKELIGKSKRPIGNIKLIDINEEEILPEKDLWMTKSLTDPEMAPKAQTENPVDPTRRKKHHITYLAQQAKANEQELQNAWSASKNNRMATRAKYGF